MSPVVARFRGGPLEGARRALVHGSAIYKVVRRPNQKVTSWDPVSDDPNLPTGTYRRVGELRRSPGANHAVYEWRGWD